MKTLEVKPLRLTIEVKTMNVIKPKRVRVKTDVELASLIKRDILLEPDANQHDIAAKYGINQGRVSEIKNGHRFADVPPAA